MSKQDKYPEIFYAFCADKKNQHGMDKPFVSTDGRMYATNGKITIRSKRDTFTPNVHETRFRHDIEALFAGNFLKPSLELPGDIPMVAPSFTSVCKDCDGKGVWSFGTGDHQCESCDGIGLNRVKTYVRIGKLGNLFVHHDYIIKMLAPNFNRWGLPRPGFVTAEGDEYQAICMCMHEAHNEEYERLYPHWTNGEWVIPDDVRAKVEAAL